MQTLEWQTESVRVDREPARPNQAPARSREAQTGTDYVPPRRGAPRPAKEIAMRAHRQQERRLAGW